MFIGSNTSYGAIPGSNVSYDMTKFMIGINYTFNKFYTRLFFIKINFNGLIRVVKFKIHFLHLSNKEIICSKKFLEVPFLV
jgi:hypothetical protein